MSKKPYYITTAIAYTSGKPVSSPYVPYFIYLHLRKQTVIQDLYLGIQQRCIYYSVTSCAVFGRIAFANTLAEPKSVLSLS